MATRDDGFNFIMTTYKGLEVECVAEALAILTAFGDAGPKAWTTGVSGLAVGVTSLDPKLAVRKLREAIAGDPWAVRLLLRFIPVETVVQATPEDVHRAAEAFALRIGEGESFRVTAERRHNQTPTAEFVEAAASAVKRKVDLEAPDWVVQVEVIRDLAGMSLLKPDEVFSSVREKRGT
jgi:tRNA acetyltransferase TAN1